MLLRFSWGRRSESPPVCICVPFPKMPPQPCACPRPSPSTCRSTVGLCPGAESAPGERAGCSQCAGERVWLQGEDEDGDGMGTVVLLYCLEQADAFRHNAPRGQLILAPGQISCAPWAAADAVDPTSSHCLAHRARGNRILPHRCTGMERQSPLHLGMMLWVRIPAAPSSRCLLGTPSAAEEFSAHADLHHALSTTHRQPVCYLWGAGISHPRVLSLALPPLQIC